MKVIAFNCAVKDDVVNSCIEKMVGAGGTH